MRRHRIVAALAPVVCALGLTACGSSGSPTVMPTGSAHALAAVDNRTVVALTPTPTPHLPVTVTDPDGRRITVTSVDRIVSLTGSISEIAYTLGQGPHVVGRDVSTTIAAAASVPVVTQAHTVSAESVLSLHPTLVLADADTGPPEAITQIRDAGVAVVVIPAVNSVTQVGPRIEAVATALGLATAGKTLAARTATELTAAEQHGQPATKLKVAFLYLRGSAGVYLIGGKGSGADSLIQAAGAVDVGSSLGLTKFRPITSEALIAAQPDVLLLMTDGLASVGGMKGLEQIPGVAQTPAGKHQRVITIEDGVLLGFGPRTPEVVAALADDLRSMAR